MKKQALNEVIILVSALFLLVAIVLLSPEHGLRANQTNTTTTNSEKTSFNASENNETEDTCLFVSCSGYY